VAAPRQPWAASGGRRVDGGPDLGTRDTLLFDQRSGFFDFFNRVGGFPVVINRQVWCAGANP
jgi:hypothetical protein